MIDKPGWLIELITNTEGGGRSEFFDVAIPDHNEAADLIRQKHTSPGSKTSLVPVEPLLMGYLAMLGLNQGQYRRYEGALEHHQAQLD